jgi:hypothetical protein
VFIRFSEADEAAARDDLEKRLSAAGAVPVAASA